VQVGKTSGVCVGYKCARFLKLLRVGAGLNFASTGADKKFQDTQDSSELQAGAYPGGLFGCHNRPSSPQVLSIRADKISNAVTAGL